MDKERKAYEELLNTINSGASSSSTANQGHYKCQLEFLHDIESQPLSGPYGESISKQLAHLLEQEALLSSGHGNDDSPSIAAWLLWLIELLQSRKQVLGETQPLLQWLLHYVEQQQCRVNALRCLLPLLETPLVSTDSSAIFQRLALIPLPANVEASLLLVLCQDKLFTTLYSANANALELQQQQLQVIEQLAKALLQAHYDGRWIREAPQECEQLTLLAAHSLQLLQKITSLHDDFAQEHAPELLGLSLAHVRSRAEDGAAATVSLPLPHSIHPAQQLAAYGHDDEDITRASAAAAGRRIKSRKMRSLTKHRNNGNNVQESSTTGPAAAGNGDRIKQLLLSPSGGESEGGCTTPNSDGANGQQQLAVDIRQQRKSLVKVRIAALQLLGAVTKQLPRRTLYGYWHALFPSDGGEVKDHLLHIGASDGNVRCRVLALQLAAQLLYGSKPYLSQASSSSTPSNYTPFALSVAGSVLAAYRQLTSILEREYVPPVLTQCLKCLAVLVQATPFDQLQMGIVYEFVPHVKTLTRHVDTSVKVSALLVMEMVVATPRLTQEMACAVGLPPSERRRHQELEQQFQKLCDSDEEQEEEAEEELEEESESVFDEQSQMNNVLPRVRIPRNSWLLRLVLRYLESPASASPLRIECLQVILAMTTHFSLLRDHLVRLAHVLCAALEDSSLDVRLYGARCLDAIGFQMAQTTEPQPELHLNFWLRMLPAIYGAYSDAANATATLRSSLFDALANMGCNSFERLPQAQRNGLLAFLLGSSSDDTTDHLVRAAAVRVLAVYVLHPSLRSDLVFVEHAAELALRLTNDLQLAVRIKAAWALGNISDALVAADEPEAEHEPEKERISLALLQRLIEAAVLACADHDKVRANAVRALGNLLRLLTAQEDHALMQRAMQKLLDCVRAAGSAKVKWNACYALGNLVRNRAIFAISANLAGTLFAALGQLIVQHANFKVRINATAVLLQIEQRADFGVHYANMWRSLLAAVERSNALDTFEEYNHRDGLQQQLCLAMAHMLGRARPDDLLTCRDALETHLDAFSGTWRRVAFRIVPEQAAPLFTCGSLLQQRLTASPLTAEQRSALTFLAGALRLES